MAEAAVPQDAEPPKRSKLPLLVGVLAAVALGAAGFYATYSGIVLGASGHASDTTGAGALPDIAFVEIAPLILSLGPAGASQHLRFAAQLEVASEHSADVTLLMPRILDVLNGYLRAVEVAELEDPAALTRLRAQMLRRVQIVTGEGRVRDLLVTEFVLN